MGTLRRNNESEFHFETAGISKLGQVAPSANRTVREPY